MNDMEYLMDMWRNQEAEESFVEGLSDDEFYDYREKVYGIPKPENKKV